MVTKTLTGWLMMLMLVQIGTAQERLYNFEWFTNEQQIPGNTVKRIMTDRDGQVWLATNKGLGVFDAVNTRHFTHDYRNPNSISSNNLSGIHEDKHGVLWITSYTGGLSCYDKAMPRDQAFINFTAYRDGADTVAIRMLSDVVSDNEGNLWFGGQDTDLLKMDAATKQISRISLVPDTMGRVSIYCVYRTTDGNIWLGTRHHGIFRLNTATGETTAYNLKPWAKPWIEENGCGSFVEHEGMLWFSYYDHDLCRIDLKSGKMETGVLKLGPNNRVYDNAIHSIAIHGNAVLAGHSSNGLYRYEWSTGQIALINWEILTPSSPTPAPITALEVDSEGSVWIGTEDKGLIRYSDHRNRFNEFYPLVTTDPIAHLSVEDGKWWYRSEKGIGIYDPVLQETIKTYDYQGLWVSNFAKIGGVVYLSTYDRGVWTLDAFGRKAPLPIKGETYGFRLADCGNIVADTIDGVPYLWIAAWNAGLYRYNCSDQSIQLTDAKNGLPDNKLICMSKDTRGNVWIGTDGFGLLRLADKKSVTFDRFVGETTPTIASNTVRAIAPAHDGSIWVVTEFLGVSHIREINGDYTIQNIPNTNSRPWQNPNHAQIDAVGNLWISTADGLMVVEQTSKKFLQLQPGKGIVPQEYLVLKAFTIQADSTIVLATNRGFVVGNAASIRSKDPLPKAIVNAFFIHDRDSSHLLLKPHIELRHDQNFFSFAFSTSGVIDPHDVHFAFMLEGVDKTWRQANGDFSVSYTDVKRGDYRFLVRTGDFIGNWSTDIQPTYIRVNGPFWQTPWFYTLLASLFFVTAYSFFRYRLHQSRKLNAIQLLFNEDLKQQLALKTAEVKAQTERTEAEKKEKLESDYQKRLSESELKAVRAQLNPHFMFNVLNSIESYILEHDASTASLLVQKFAKLNRLVLENSANSYVNVWREWEALQLYVELEALRFNGAFDYKFVFHDEGGLKDALIPPMLVQPLIENAIHHGIRQNAGRRGKILINVARINNRIRFIIIDNGVGMKKLRCKPAHPYKKTSMGIATIEERLRLINRSEEHYSGSLEFIDLGDKRNSGTKAILYIPLITSPVDINE